MFSKQECNSQRNSSDDSHENKQADDTLKTPPQDDSQENKHVDDTLKTSSQDDSHENNQAHDTLKTPSQDDAIVRNVNPEIVDPQWTTNLSIIEKELIFISFLCML